MNKITVAASLIFIFLFSLIIRSYPIQHRGYPAEINATSLILARNLSLTDKYSFESENNVILSSDSIEEKGVLSDRSNKLTTFLYKYIFDAFGFRPDLAVWVSLLIFALTNIILFLLVLKLFNFYLAFLFSIIDILMPFIIRGSGIAGFYEWAMLFFVIGLFFYLCKDSQILAGIFFTLAVWARNAFLVSFLPFVCYDFWKNRSYKRIAVFLLPFILFGLFTFRGPNFYVNTFLTQAEKYEGHLFPDPYTYHFEKEKYLESIENPTGEQILFLQGYDKVSFSQKLSSYLSSLKFYLRESLRIVTLGGVWMILFLILGISFLYRRKNSLWKLFLLWGIFWFGSLVVLKTSNWDHFLEIRFPIVLLISLGIYWIVELMGKRIDYKYLWAVVLLITVSLHLVEASRWTFHETYNSSQMETVLSLVPEIDQQDDVVGVGISESAAVALNYYTDQNLVYFDPQTVQKLLKENRLAWAFRQFGVARIAGFDSDLSEEMVNQTGVENISLKK